MKTNRLALAVVLTASATQLDAAPLTATTAVHAKPNASAPAIAILKAGAEPVVVIDAAAAVGWQAVELSGPHEVYVHGKDLTKNLDIKPGAEFRTAPKADAPVLATMTPGDKAEITGLRGKWTQMSLDKKIIGYIRTDGATGPAASAYAPKAASTPNSKPETLNSSLPTAPIPATASTAGGPGRPAQMLNLGDGGSSALPRLFQGQLVSSRRLLGLAKSPYAFQLNDNAGARYAYLDVSKLLLTDQIDNYIDRTVVVYGTAKPVPNSKDIVIQVESLQLR
jgi:hypothetical protein